MTSHVPRLTSHVSRPRLTAFCSLLTADCRLLTADCSLLVARCALPTASSQRVPPRCCMPPLPPRSASAPSRCSPTASQAPRRTPRLPLIAVVVGADVGGSHKHTWRPRARWGYRMMVDAHAVPCTRNTACTVTRTACTPHAHSAHTSLTHHAHTPLTPRTRRAPTAHTHHAHAVRTARHAHVAHVMHLCHVHPRPCRAGGHLRGACCVRARVCAP